MNRRLNRRSLLSASVLGAIGVPLFAPVRSHAQGDPKLRWGKNPRPAKACILLYMNGGPSHIDTFDPKPGRPTGGPFHAINTTTEGVQVSEHLPQIADRMKHIALLRSVTSKEGNHDRARHLMHTGYAPAAGADHPALGALLSERNAGDTHDLPGYVSIGGAGEDSGFLAAAHSPFPVKNPTKPVRNLSPAKGIDAARFERRLGLLSALDSRFAQNQGGVFARDRAAISKQAIALMRAEGVSAFDLEKESTTTRSAFGDNEFGQGCLMARRLVEAGVPFVEVTLNGWDTHDDAFERITKLSKTLDQGAAALLDDLLARDLLKSTMVVWMGDFGRTPTINEKGGRDHFPKAFSAWIAGGGIRGGQVIGATDADGSAVVTRPLSVTDLYRSLAYGLDLNPDKVRTAPSGRPIKTVDGGALIDGLFA